MTTIRSELSPLPRRMRALPLDHRGYPVPWFVAWVDGKPEFRAMDRAKWARAIRERRCWVCGDVLGKHLAFVIGPMCAVSGTTAEPPNHLECAEWSAQNCPFLARPHMTRREDDTINVEQLSRDAAGIPIARNPGVACVWVTSSFKVFTPPVGGGQLITIGPASSVRWFAHGRPATRAEVEASIASGSPALEKMAALQTGGLEALDQARAAVDRWLPQETA